MMRSLIKLVSSRFRTYIPQRFLHISGNPSRSSKLPSLLEDDRNIRLPEDCVPTQSDVIIVGGGLTGWSCAYWLRAMSKYSVTLIEKDPTYEKTSLNYPGFLRQQYSLPENVQMSLFVSDFLRNIETNLGIDGVKPSKIQFNPHGHLMLTNEAGYPRVQENFALQKALGAAVELLTPEDIVSRWPWINPDGIACATIGYENEGWFDSPALLQAIRRKAHDMGVSYLVGNVIDFELSDDPSYVDMGRKYPDRPAHLSQALKYTKVKMADGDIRKIRNHYVINAGGFLAHEVARMARINPGSDDKSVPLPFESARRHLFVVKPLENIDPVNVPSIDAPFLIDYSGLHVQRLGLSGDFAVYFSDEYHNDLWLQNCSEEQIKSIYKDSVEKRLIGRIPSMTDANIRTAWSSLRPVNLFDNSPVVGFHPIQAQMIFACGVESGHSIAVGKAVAELVFFHDYRSIDLTSFGLERFMVQRPLMDKQNTDSM